MRYISAMHPDSPHREGRKRRVLLVSGAFSILRQAALVHPSTSQEDRFNASWIRTHPPMDSSGYCEPPHTTVSLRSTRASMSNYGCNCGFALVSAIFLLVVLAALGAFMVTFSTAQHAASAQDVLSARAVQAARAGIEWGTYQVLTPVASPTVSACTINPLPLTGNLAGFTVIVECNATGPLNENGIAVTTYNITSTANTGTTGTSMFVERQFQATVSR